MVFFWVKKMRSKIVNACLAFYVKAKFHAEEHASTLLFLAGFFLLFTSVEDAFAFGNRYGQICVAVLDMFENQNFGALCTACAGMGAICAAAMGGFKMAWTLVVVSIGSFVLREYYQIFFPECQ